MTDFRLVFNIVKNEIVSSCLSCLHLIRPLFRRPLLFLILVFMFLLGGGGGAVVPRYEKISLLRRGADPAALASSSSSLSNTATATADDAAASSSDDDEDDDDMAIQAKCQPLHESECDRARDCTWCVSRAVPSKCYASSLVARLPEKTFECAAGTTTASASSSESSAEKKEKEEEKNEVVEVFDFAGGTTLTLSSAEVDKTFCDASSPISLAGYMNGE